MTMAVKKKFPYKAALPGWGLYIWLHTVRGLRGGVQIRRDIHWSERRGRGGGGSLHCLRGLRESLPAGNYPAS